MRTRNGAVLLSATRATIPRALSFVTSCSAACFVSYAATWTVKRPVVAGFAAEGLGAAGFGSAGFGAARCVVSRRGGPRRALSTRIVSRTIARRAGVALSVRGGWDGGACEGTGRGADCVVSTPAQRLA